MGYNDEVHQIISTLKEGLIQLEDYLLNKELEYKNRFEYLEGKIEKNNETKRKLLQVLQEDINGI